MWKAVIIQDCAVSIVHEDFKHGFVSLGWNGEYKQTLFETPEHAEIYELSYKEIKELGYRIGKKEFTKKQKQWKQYKHDMLTLHLEIAEHIAKTFNKKYPHGLPSFGE